MSSEAQEQTDRPSTSRRNLLIGVAALLAQAGFWSNPLFGSIGYAQTLPSSVPPAPAIITSSSAFLVFSRAITGHTEVRPETAARIEAAMLKTVPGFAATLQKLTVLQPTQPNDPKALLAAATDAGLRDITLAIVAAWYTGTVGKGTKAVVVSYAEALMYKPVADGQVVPTYCNYGPQWWTQAPPPIRVSAPVAPKPTPVPAATGTAEPQKNKSI